MERGAPGTRRRYYGRGDLLRQLQLLPPPISRNELTLARGHREGETRPWLIGTARVDFPVAASAAGVCSRRVHILRTLAGGPRCRVAGSAAPAERPHDTGPALHSSRSIGRGREAVRPPGGLGAKEEPMKGVVSIG